MTILRSKNQAMIYIGTSCFFFDDTEESSAEELAEAFEIYCHANSSLGIENLPPSRLQSLRHTFQKIVVEDREYADFLLENV